MRTERKKITPRQRVQIMRVAINMQDICTSRQEMHMLWQVLTEAIEWSNNCI